MDSYLVFDFETTGLDDQSDRIIQVGTCAVDQRRPVNRQAWLVCQDVEIPEEVTAIHGVDSATMRRDGITPETSLTRLLDAVRDAPAVMGHNIHRFDVLFLRAECDRLDVEAPDVSDWIDTAALYKGRALRLEKDPDETHAQYANRVLSIRRYGLRYSVGACCETLGIQTDDARMHDAGGDTLLTHRIYEALRG